MKKRSQENGSHESSNGSNSYSNGTTDSLSHRETQDVSLMNKVSRSFSHLFNFTLLPVLLMLTVPNVIMLVWFTATRCEGSYEILYNKVLSKGLVEGLIHIWSGVTFVSTFTICLLLGYCAWAILLMLILPGPTAKGPITPKGNIPVYTDNGFYCYIVTMAAFGILTYFMKQNGMTPTIIYDRFDEILCTLNLFSLVFCAGLYIKGLISPSTSDNGSSGNIIFDYYWGTELYPRIMGVDIKVFTNCRFGMTVWPLLVVVFWLKSYELYGFVDSMFVCMVLQLLYCTKFFWWEAGYMNTIDIMLDRAGFYICWGCLVFIPGFYCSTSLFMVTHPVQLGLPITVGVLMLGALGVWVNYWADRQKQHVRQTDGQCTIWGSKPQIIRAKYTVDNVGEKESILLASGFWGISRHFHYIPELALSFCWSVPALFTHIMPYAYFIYLAVLLTHRSIRDENKCRKKYNHYWKQYCDKVPYRMVPFLY